MHCGIVLKTIFYIFEIESVVSELIQSKISA